ncbi:MAG: hypothetical protein ACTSVU_06765 [Promethearchaeota archaeon]
MLHPYIEIEVLSLRDPKLTEKDILQTIKLRAEKIHPYPVVWHGTEEHPKLYMEYPSVEIFSSTYNAGIASLNRIMESLNKGLEFPMGKLVGPKDFEKNYEEKDVYLTLKYRANFREPMKKNYQMSNKVAKILGTRFYIEEVFDGFLMFYKFKEDFEIAQIDREDSREIIKWCKQKNFSPENPVVKDLLKYLEKVKALTMETAKNQ